ncbi:hypothetical protein ml_279 [Mollivirus sibericum]|uniref:hypothetical protein n=1 Tax=Mollivirus sibericum TaxID=1678078 RepID=UPI0006B2EEBD|nr:hypothetical protein ml_279 [Mollivirus sibericum]ALD62081.1 hypothetical protein ml_279 [Mollivirus sibericum]
MWPAAFASSTPLINPCLPSAPSASARDFDDVTLATGRTDQLLGESNLAQPWVSWTYSPTDDNDDDMGCTKRKRAANSISKRRKGKKNSDSDSSGKPPSKRSKKFCEVDDMPPPGKRHSNPEYVEYESSLVGPIKSVTLDSAEDKIIKCLIHYRGHASIDDIYAWMCQDSGIDLHDHRFRCLIRSTININRHGNFHRVGLSNGSGTTHCFLRSLYLGMFGVNSDDVRLPLDPVTGSRVKAYHASKDRVRHHHNNIVSTEEEEEEDEEEDEDRGEETSDDQQDSEEPEDSEHQQEEKEQETQQQQPLYTSREPTEAAVPRTHTLTVDPMLISPHLLAKPEPSSRLVEPLGTDDESIVNDVRACVRSITRRALDTNWELRTDKTEVASLHDLLPPLPPRSSWSAMDWPCYFEEFDRHDVGQANAKSEVATTATDDDDFVSSYFDPSAWCLA